MPEFKSVSCLKVELSGHEHDVVYDRLSVHQ